MRSKEFIKEAPGSPGRGPGREMTDAQRAEQEFQGEKNLQSIKNWWNNAPQTGAASNMARDPAQLGGQGRPENSMDDSDDFYAKPFVPPAAPAGSTIPAATRNRVDRTAEIQADAAAAAAAAAEQNRKPIGTTERDPAATAAPAAAPSFNVPGAAQAGQQGSNYTTGVEQDRPHRPDAGADETTRNDYPFSPPEPGPGPKPVVKPIPSPQPRPKPTGAYAASGGMGGGTALNKPQGDMVDGTYIPDPNTGGYSATYMPSKTAPSGGNNATPATTRGYPNPVTDPEGYKKAINQGLVKKYSGNEQPAQAATPATASSVVVKSGDTLSKIAAANGTTVPAIMALNPSITNANRIAAGQTVKLRESSEVARIRHLAGLNKG